MPQFTYQAIDNQGAVISGSMDVMDERALVDKLQAMGYYPLKVARPEEKKKSPFFQFLPSGVSQNDIIAFTHQLSTMLNAGLPLDRSLAILSELEENKILKGIISELYKGIQAGKPLAQSMAAYPKVFSGIYTNLLKAGEASGTLEPALARLTRFLEESQHLRDEIKSALIYPALLTTVGGAAVAVMLVFVIPRFSEIFSDMGGVLPLPTRILMGISSFIVNYWWAIFGIMAAAAIGLIRYIKTDAGRLMWDSIKLKIPMFGMLHLKAVVSRFARTLGTLLQSGLPITEAMKITKDTMGNAYLNQSMSPVIDGIKRGRGIARPLKDMGRFPALSIHLITVGEETGKLDDMLIKLAEAYETDLRTSTKRFVSLLEPALILIMGAIVGFIVLSMLLAIFSINEIPF
ncbi:MAG: type II secretion system protein GspF [Deltaproteobacteria bacterium GWD2_42_10]|nr:MAG: type II secretion system protein GspF [Deltaproteobacteria bacterium GWD2_42_10]